MPPCGVLCIPVSLSLCRLWQVGRLRGIIPSTAMKSRSFLLPLTLTACAVAALTSHAEIRKWTSKAGTSLEAEMTGVDVAARTISLKKTDGSVITIPIDALTDADRDFAAAEWKKMQSAPAGAPAAPASAPAAAPKAATKGALPAPTGAPAPPRPALTITPVKGFKVPAAADYLRGVQKTRPRLIHAAAGWEYLKGQASSNPVAGKMLENLKAGGEKVLEAPELTRIFGEMRSTVTPGSKALFRMATLGALNFVDGDPRWKERGVRELIAITDPTVFTNWYVDEPEVLADFLIAASLGYDYFRDGLNDQQAAAVRTYMVEKGIGALAAHLEGEPMPESARGRAPGTSASKAPAKGAAKKADGPEQPDVEHMAGAAALILAAICLADEEPSAAKTAVDAAAKMFGAGMQMFAPAGIWPEGMEAGETVLDYAIMVMQTLKANSGSDFGFSLLEGIPQAGLARVHLVGPTNQLFNYGDTNSTALSRAWVSTWLAGAHGNMGTKALTAGTAPGADTAHLNLAGHFMYFNPHAAGDGTPDSLDYTSPGALVAAHRTGWDKDALYIAVKGGDNSFVHNQLDLGAFVLDAGGTRWGIELGEESDRAPGFTSTDRNKRYELYVEGTAGQNTLWMEGNQEFDAKAAVVMAHSTPALAMSVIDLGKAYSKPAKDALRGVMITRGDKPQVLVQDEIGVKNNTHVVWTMHTRAEVSADGKKAVLTDKGRTLHATLLSPAQASFSVGEPPEPTNEQMKKLTGIRVLKVDLGTTKGDHTIAVAFALDEAPAEAPVKPIAEWAPKR